MATLVPGISLRTSPSPLSTGRRGPSCWWSLRSTRRTLVSAPCPGQPRPPEPVWALPLLDVPLLGLGGRAWWGGGVMSWEGLGAGRGPTTTCCLAPRPGRLGRVPHAEDAHGDGDDQVSRLPLRGARMRGLGYTQNVCQGSRPSGPRRAPVSLKWESAWCLCLTTWPSGRGLARPSSTHAALGLGP